MSIYSVSLGSRGVSGVLIFVPKIVNLIFRGVSNKSKEKSKTRIFVRFEQTFDEFLVRKFDFFDIYSTNMGKIVFSIFYHRIFASILFRHFRILDIRIHFEVLLKTSNFPWEEWPCVDDVWPKNCQFLSNIRFIRILDFWLK